MSRTDQEIVDQTNDLALLLLADVLGTGYVPEDVNIKLYNHLDNPRYAKAWAVACSVQELMTQTDPNDALSSLPDTSWFEVKLTETVTYTLRVQAVDEDEAKDSARESWAQSGDPTADFDGQGHGVEVESVRSVEE